MGVMSPSARVRERKAALAKVSERAEFAREREQQAPSDPPVDEGGGDAPAEGGGG